MINQTLAAVLFASLAGMPAVAGADVLAPLLWKQRAVVVFGGGDERQRRQVAALEASKGLLADYETTLIVAADDDARLRGKFGVSGRGFAVVLVGKDGDAKRTWREPVEPARIFGLIDRMPMRRDEVRDRR